MGVSEIAECRAVINQRDERRVQGSRRSRPVILQGAGDDTMVASRVGQRVLCWLPLQKNWWRTDDSEFRRH